MAAFFYERFPHCAGCEKNSNSCLTQWAKEPAIKEFVRCWEIEKKTVIFLGKAQLADVARQIEFFFPEEFSTFYSSNCMRQP